ncbi:hypothetical protein ACS50_08750 [Brucella melitensis]|nr:hypothetical protein ADS31_10360 [Brucella melitensis]KPJ45920.1 hypothetical protein ACS50_08750 [Brucella melitensis]KPJ47655.1 hypothetical protein ADS39_11725 [Brucella melitensis]
MDGAAIDDHPTALRAHLVDGVFIAEINPRQVYIDGFLPCGFVQFVDGGIGCNACICEHDVEPPIVFHCPCNQRLHGPGIGNIRLDE